MPRQISASLNRYALAGSKSALNASTATTRVFGSRSSAGPLEPLAPEGSPVPVQDAASMATVATSASQNER
jgi:hypothetical protein